MDALEERSLLLRQHLREAELELLQKRARVEALTEEEARLRDELARCGKRIAALDEDITLALDGGKEDLARFAIRRVIPERKERSAIEAQMAERGMTPLEIARYIDVDPGSLTRLLDRMEDKGLIQRLPVDGDRRSIRIAVTPHAAALAPRLAALADANDARFFDALPADEARAFRTTLARLLRAQGVEVPEDWERG